MKKLILPFVFVFSLSFGYSANLSAAQEDNDCHAEACEYVAFVEEDQELNEEAANAAYDQGYEFWMNN